MLSQITLQFLYTLLALFFGNRNDITFFINKLHPAVNFAQVMTLLIAVLYMFGRRLVFQLLLAIIFAIRVILRAKNFL